MANPSGRHLDARTLLPRDYATVGEDFGVVADLAFHVPYSGDIVSKRIAQLQHDLVCRWTAPGRDPSARTLADRWGTSPQTISAVCRGTRWAGETVLALLLDANGGHETIGRPAERSAGTSGSADTATAQGDPVDEPLVLPPGITVGQHREPGDRLITAASWHLVRGGRVIDAGNGDLSAGDLDDIADHIGLSDALVVTRTGIDPTETATAGTNDMEPSAMSADHSTADLPAALVRRAVLVIVDSSVHYVADPRAVGDHVVLRRGSRQASGAPAVRYPVATADAIIERLARHQADRLGEASGDIGC